MPSNIFLISSWDLTRSTFNVHISTRILFVMVYGILWDNSFLYCFLTSILAFTRITFNAHIPTSHLSLQGNLGFFCQAPQNSPIPDPLPYFHIFVIAASHFQVPKLVWVTDLQRNRTSTIYTDAFICIHISIHIYIWRDLFGGIGSHVYRCWQVQNLWCSLAVSKLSQEFMLQSQGRISSFLRSLRFCT